MIKKNLGLKPNILRFYMSEILLSIEHIHDCGIFDRDLKMENIMITARGHIKLIDFGLSKFIGKKGRTYTQCGTVAYLAPEIINGIGYNVSVDLWSFGILICELVGGFTPF